MIDYDLTVIPAIPAVVIPGFTYRVTTGGSPVTVAQGNLGGGLITNPLTAADQGLSNPERLYVNPVDSNMGLVANGKIIALNPGETWRIFPSQVNATTVNAVTSGHKFTIVVWFFVPPTPPLPGEGILRFDFPDNSGWWEIVGL